VTRFRLERVDGGRTETVFDGDAASPVVLGRSEKGQVVLADPSVSKQHASIEETADGLLLRDVGSLNGTRRGKQKVAEKGVILADGDELRLGQTMLRLHVLADVKSPAGKVAEPSGAARPKEAIPPKEPAPPREPPAKVRPPVAEPEPPREQFAETFGSYGIVRPLDPRGDGETSLAVDTRTRTRVALKRIPTARFGWFGVNGFLRACEAAGRIRHENLVAPLESGKAGKVAFVACPYVQGVSVETILRETPKDVTIELALHIGREVARGLAHLEKAGLGARPEVTDRRVMLTNEGRAVLVGAGVPPASDETRGAARYLAPEEDGGKKGDARAAVFALGVVLYELLIRERIDAGQKTRLRAVETLRIDVSEALGQATMRALRVRPEARYDSAAELEEELSEELQRLNPNFGVEEVKRWLVRRYPDVGVAR
jgi:hypothetical protein